MIKLITAGGRDFRNKLLFEETMASLTITPDEVVCGMASGADELGRQWAIANNVLLKEFRADWGRLGKSAGPKRNKSMAEYSTHLLAFWNGESRGTDNMLKLAQKHNLKIKLITY
jgi:YspA, cpYpsA-related SLOG family